MYVFINLLALSILHKLSDQQNIIHTATEVHASRNKSDFK